MDLNVIKFIYKKLDTLVESIQYLKRCYINLSQEFQCMISGLKIGLMLVKQVVGGNSGKGEAYSKVKMPEAKAFTGVQSSKEFEIFLQDIEYYFKATMILDSEKIFLNSMYLAEDATLW